MAVLGTIEEHDVGCRSSRHELMSCASDVPANAGATIEGATTAVKVAYSSRKHVLVKPGAPMILP